MQGDRGVGGGVKQVNDLREASPVGGGVPMGYKPQMT